MTHLCVGKESNSVTILNYENDIIYYRKHKNKKILTGNKIVKILHLCKIIQNISF